ncbi:hypothetical protein [Streptomyces sp. NPDC048411]|uniref:hypothetical protein n=1 Tax=unclassified Streptomyces TaxID=2593676 RepID=UPI0034534780
MPSRLEDVVHGLAEAGLRGDVAAVRAALDADVVAVCDSGGIVPAATGTVHGAEDVADLVAVLLGGLGTEVIVESVNGRAGLAVRQGPLAIAVIGVGEAGARVTNLWIVLNPAKLNDWHRPPADR